MNYPAPQPDPHPTGPHGPREFASGAALYTGQPHNHCQYCGKRAEVWDIDGSYCSAECRRYNKTPCPECNDIICGGRPDQRWEHERQFRGSEDYARRVALYGVKAVSS